MCGLTCATQPVLASPVVMNTSLLAYLLKFLQGPTFLNQAAFNNFVMYVFVYMFWILLNNAVYSRIYSPLLLRADMSYVDDIRADNVTVFLKKHTHPFQEIFAKALSIKKPTKILWFRCAKRLKVGSDLIFFNVLNNSETMRKILIMEYYKLNLYNMLMTGNYFLSFTRMRPVV